jgi:acetylornithine deacetylase/succinyl-diaminopimelate desuccinylase-like protein
VAGTDRDRWIAELIELIRFRTISAQPAHANDLRRCAAWLARQLAGVGLEHARVIPTRGYPIVYADWLHAGSRPTAIFYGHYDVQPADPLRAWRFPPFAPLVDRDHLFGRGASDDKGQLFVHVKAFETLLRTSGALPINVKCVFEGEEEIGSPSLPDFLRMHRARLAADLAVISDTAMRGVNRPAITYGLRGALSVDLEVRGPRRDLHSGQYGGAVHNPLQALSEILASLHDASGHVAIPGFYDRVRLPGPEQRARMAASGPTDVEITRQAGIDRPWGEPTFSAYERTTIRPAVTINGLSGGYQGPGAKGVIPVRASAKLNIRLVPDQVPAEIRRLLGAHIARVTPPAIQTRLRTHFMSPPVLIDPEHPAVLAAVEAYRLGFGASTVLLRSGGTIPAVGLFRDLLGIPTVLMGFALPDDGKHGPNERLHLPTFFKAIATSIAFMRGFATRWKDVHDYRLPLSRRDRRRPDRPVGHCRAPRALPATSGARRH